MYSILVWALQFAVTPVPPPDSAPSIQMQVTKEKSLFGEPIELRVSVHNPTTNVISIDFHYPMPEAIREETMSLELKADGINFREEMLRPKPTDRGDCGPIECIKIEPKKSWDFCFYLQRFCDQPKEGRYTLCYELILKYDMVFPSGKLVPFWAKCKGELHFSILAADDKALEVAFEKYKKQAAARDDLRQREAIEALSVTDSPLAVPHLLELASKDRPRAIRALVKHREHPDVKKAVTKAVKSEDDLLLAAGLDVMGQWKMEVELDRFKEILLNRDGLVQMSVREYVERLKNAEYKKLLDEREKKDD